ncbi:MAG: DNA-binding protein [Candidatus Woesearchaeota archaeon]
MSELDEIRKRKMEEFKKDQGGYQPQQSQEEEQAKQQLQQLESIVKQRMTKEALQRYGNIKAADHEKASQVMLLLAQLLQGGRLSTIDDSTLKDILSRTTPRKREMNIKRK